MTKILDYKTKKLREVILDPGEQHYLCKLNLRLIREQNAKKKEKK